MGLKPANAKVASLFSDPLIRQILLFILVGCVCYLFGISLLILLVEIGGLEVNLANLIASLFAIYVAYVLNARFIFKGGRYSYSREIFAFYIFSAMGLGINITLMFLMTKYLPISYVISKTIVTAIVAGFNFVSRKYLVFKG